MKESRHNYKNLKIWKLAIDIAEQVFEVLEKFPSEEKFGLNSQISRASISMPSNIAEGSSRTTKSFIHFLDVSLGSSYELETQFLIALKRNYLNEKKYNQIIEEIEEFQKMTVGFQRKLKASLDS
ncbi:MAG: four helix bundle protein [Vicingaceae bacterium]